MKAAIVVVFVLSLAIAVEPARAQRGGTASTEGQASGIVRGRITAADTGKPLRRARVMLMAASESSASTPIVANTNSTGQFEARGVPDGFYYVSTASATRGNAACRST
jgi:hypothetical protein